MGQADKHTTVYLQTVHVARFDGSQPELLGSFFQQIESYVNSKVTPATRRDVAAMSELYLAELPNHIDQTAELAEAIYCLGQGATDWANLKNIYLDFFRSRQDSHPVHQLSGLLNYKRAEKTSMLVYVSKVWKQVDSLLQTIRDDPDQKWGQDGDGKLSLEEFGALLHQTLVLDSLPPQAQKSLVPHLGPNTERYLLAAEAERCLKEVDLPPVKLPSSATPVETQGVTSAVVPEEKMRTLAPLRQFLGRSPEPRAPAWRDFRDGGGQKPKKE